MRPPRPPEEAGAALCQPRPAETPVIDLLRPGGEGSAVACPRGAASSAADLGQAADGSRAGGPSPSACAPALWAATEPGARPTAYRRWIRPALGALLVAGLAVPVGVAVAAVAALQLAVERDPRLVFFRQLRAGRHGRPFRIVKFRTLEPGPDGELRATRLGPFLRATHLDELPQLWNVFVGDMALIGPRPETLEHERWAEEHVPGFARRLAIAPGITGLAQVVQDSTPMDVDLYREKLRLNERYLGSMGLSLDAWILVRTALRPFRPRPYAGEAPSEAPSEAPR